MRLAAHPGGDAWRRCAGLGSQPSGRLCCVCICAAQRAGRWRHGGWTGRAGACSSAATKRNNCLRWPVPASRRRWCTTVLEPALAVPLQNGVLGLGHEKDQRSNRPSKVCQPCPAVAANRTKPKLMCARLLLDVFDVQARWRRWRVPGGCADGPTPRRAATYGSPPACIAACSTPCTPCRCPV